jgi:O-antigen/teichoic acid export membrane protein
MSDTTKSFARQGMWMVAATLAGGGLMMFVHTFISKRCGDAVYAEFKTLLSSFYVIAAVAGGLWTMFGQQTAAAVTEETARGVATSARRALAVILVVWLMVALGLVMYQGDLIRLWKLSGPGALWATWVLGLLTLWVSVLRGVTQGLQNFAALGWLVILDGVGRFAGVIVMVTVFAATLGGATGALVGASMGCLAALLVGLWGSRSLLRLPGGKVDGAVWRTGFVPLAINAAALQLFQQYDVMYWKAVIPAAAAEEWTMGFRYLPAQTVGFGLTQFTVPLALVMLPRVARSVAKGEKSDSLRLTLMATGVMGGLAALGCTVFPKLPLQVMFFNDPRSWVASPLVPWFAWAMLFFTLSNVLLNDLFARRRFGVVWVVIGIAMAYVATLQWMRPHLVALPPELAYRRGVQVLAGFMLVQLMTVATWVRRR